MSWDATREAAVRARLATPVHLDVADLVDALCQLEAEFAAALDELERRAAVIEEQREALDRLSATLSTLVDGMQGLP